MHSSAYHLLPPCTNHPTPCPHGHRGASDLLEGQLFAYGCSSSVVVVEVGRGWSASA